MKYKIGYHSCEESSYTELEHDEKFSADDITNLVIEALLAIIPTNKITRNFENDYQDFQEQVIEWLVANKGFKPIKYEVCWSVFGWASMFDESDWASYRTIPDELSKIQKAVKHLETNLES